MCGSLAAHCFLAILNVRDVVEDRASLFSLFSFYLASFFARLTTWGYVGGQWYSALVPLVHALDMCPAFGSTLERLAGLPFLCCPRTRFP